jgi:hypothetical protein
MVCPGEFSGEVDTDDLLNEFKLPSMQEKFDKELQEIDKRLEQKEVKRLAVRELCFKLIVNSRKDLLFFDMTVRPCIRAASFVLILRSKVEVPVECTSAPLIFLQLIFLQKHTQRKFSVVIDTLLQAEIKLFVRPESKGLKQHFEKKLVELEEEKMHLQVILF